MSLYIGLMSGTSMDGIDAALVDTSSHRLIHGITKQYSEEVQEKLQHLLTESTLTLASLYELNTLIGRDFAQASLTLLQQAKVPTQQITAIGSHGQTIAHDTQRSIPYTVQLGCAHTINAVTKIPVVADFRTKDLVNGGQGAPFAPLYHQELFAKYNKALAVVNIGGISNISLISPHQATTGWDIGPGNCLMDAWIKQQQGQAFDRNGHWASQGQVITSLLERLLSDPFLNQSPPKSIGKEYFSLSWLEQHIDKESAIDIQATVLALTAHSIAKTIQSLDQEFEHIYLCGGGVHNQHLGHTLSHLLPQIHLSSVAELNISPDYLEAMMCAWLASQTINQTPVNLSSITGARQATILGALYR